MRIAYVRVSTEEQNEARQREALKLYHIEKWYCEKRSAKDTNRPQLESMLEFARSGDIIYIHDFSRLARNTQDLLELVQRMQQKGIQLVSCRENVDTETATGKLMLTMIAAINEFERAILLERQKELPLQRENTDIKDVRKYRSRRILDSCLKNTKSMKLANLKSQDN